MSPADSLLSGATLFELSPDHVDEGERIGFLHEDKAAALGRTMAVFGQRDPIKVVANPKNPDKPWRLVTGMHRLIGARLEGITVWAIEVAGKPEDLADLEASENLHRRPLGPIERAMFVHSLCQAARDRIAREHGNLSQQKLAIKARWDRVKHGEIRPEQALQDETEDTGDKMSLVYGWQDSAAEALGLGDRTIKRAIRLYRLLVEPFPQYIEALAKHPVVGENDSQLRALADIQDEGLRRLTIEALLADPEIGTDDARILAGVDRDTSAAPRRPLEKYRNQITNGWGRLSLADKREFLPNFVNLLTPDLKARLRELLDGEDGNA